MVSDTKEQFQSEYQAGKIAFEGGNYRQSVQHLEVADKLINPQSRLGGEARMWLITAYQAAGKESDAIALAQKLCTHPHAEIRKQAKHLLYIIKAPQLKRPPEWMTEIPDLGSVSESDRQQKRGSGVNKLKSTSKPTQSETLDLSQVNTKDNKFIWIALLAALLTLGGLFWFS
ncbi:outer membrane protein assembly factor BamD [Oscillatoria salina]|uniref:outer membrane protein assembly factor BamD n=1 Tax=Oscillatoria salina TaxID=331517 RepID=UPI0013BA29CE|nr:outer membrane protein assembly factor BamD [Oscillatoria salina]MBZ8182518.1 outer membrane protein assembly factor BamD [Oscillatoria salina IIICB1]NET90049.1 outer membrane protein assembly factor BamD [Kamptonema sp. SIO1D9]